MVPDGSAIRDCPYLLSLFIIKTRCAGGEYGHPAERLLSPGFRQPVVSTPSVSSPGHVVYLAIDVAIFGLPGFTSKVRVFSNVIRSISSIGIAPSNV